MVAWKYAHAYKPQIAKEEPRVTWLQSRMLALANRMTALPISWRYLLTTIIIVISCYLRFLAGEDFPYPFSIYLLAIALAAYLFDSGNGVYAVLLSAAIDAVIDNYLFAYPAFYAGIRDPATIISFTLFIGSGIIIALMIEALRRTVDKISEIQTYFSQAVESSPSGIIMLDKNNKILLVNTQFERLFGYKRDEIIGRPVSAMMPRLPGLMEQLAVSQQSSFKDPRNPKDIRHDITGTCKDGTEFPIEVGINPIYTMHGKVIYISVTDITTRKENERALKELNERKDEFLATMSHELRTPMNAVIGLADILRQSRPLTEKQAQYVETLRLSAKQLMDLITDLLDLSKIENKSLKLEKIPLDLPKLIEEVCNITDIQAKEKGIALNIAYACEIPDLLGDPLRIRQILLNLAGNAVKFTDVGGITIEVECQKNHETVELVLKVRDTGKGIAPDKLSVIFEKFAQEDNTITRQYGGSGLGLAITKQLVELMGGHITVESEMGKGSCFTVTLPLSVHVAREEVKPQDKAPHHEPAKTDMRILIAEDYSPNILVLTTLLDNLGYRYDIAKNGKEALKKLEKDYFDLVLMDIEMPEMDGYAATRQWRDEEDRLGKDHVPIIGLTAHALRNDRNLCFEAGMDDYIAKPFDAVDLQEKLQRFAH